MQRESIKELLPDYKNKLQDNISFLAIPDKFKFERLDNVVLVDTPSIELTDIFTDEIRSIAVVILLGSFLLLAVMIIIGVICYKKKRGLVHYMIRHSGRSGKCIREDVELQDVTYPHETVDNRGEDPEGHGFTYVAAHN